MRIHTGKAIIILILLFGMIILFGCVGKPLNVKPVDNTKNPVELLKRLEQDLDAAQKDRVDLLSPKWFANARASYGKAKAGLDKGMASSKILKYLATGQAQLDQALVFSENSNQYISDVIESRDAALKVGADKYKKEFDKIEREFIKLTQAIEKDDTKYVQNRKKWVNEQYRILELRAIKDAALVDVRRLMETAETLNMEKYAPKSHLEAKTKHMEADTMINKDRYDKKAINEAVHVAEFYGMRLHQIVATSKKLDEMVPEDIVLWMEQFLAQTNTQLKERDRRNLSFKDQQGAILKAIGTLRRDQSSTSDQVQDKELEISKLNQQIAHLKEQIQNQNQQIKDLEGQTYEVRASEERLAVEKKFNALYRQVQGYFSSDEAEVYKKSRNLVIRLKAMKFPVGQAKIKPSNHSLLSMVERAIRVFDKPEVVVEGHTDNTGSETFNKDLSRSRAESVQQYLIQKGVLSYDNVMAKGYGSSRPVASNSTSQGRSINRRIDVIIKTNYK